MGHLMPKIGTGSEVAKSILCYLERKNLDFEQLVAIGCDGTASVWFDIKRNNSVKYGLTRVFRVIQTIRQLPVNLRKYSIFDLAECFYLLPRKYVISNGRI